MYVATTPGCKLCVADTAVWGIANLAFVIHLCFQNLACYYKLRILQEAPASSSFVCSSAVVVLS